MSHMKECARGTEAKQGTLHFNIKILHTQTRTQTPSCSFAQAYEVPDGTGQTLLRGNSALTPPALTHTFSHIEATWTQRQNGEGEGGGAARAGVINDTHQRRTQAKR